jgi:hypothetical protein
VVEAFQQAKSLLLNAVMLKLPEFDKPFELITDASIHHVGGILLQGDRPVAFESKLLSPTQHNWPTHDRELFALVYCCQKWRPYLDGTTVTAYTDHDPLKFVQTQKQLNAKQVRWLQFLQSFKPNIIYKPGVGNPADALTRLYWLKAVSTAQASRACAHRQEHHVTPAANTHAMVALVKTKPVVGTTAESCPLLLAPVQPEVFAQAYATEPDEFYATTTKRLELLAKQHITYDGKLFWHKTEKASRLCVPKSLVHLVLHYCHDDCFAGHLGYHKTLQLCSSKYWWRNLRKDVADYCRTCSACQQFKVAPFQGKELLPLPIPDGPFQSVSMDFITHLPETPRGFDSILTIVDRFSKFVVLTPCKEKISAEQVARLLAEKLIPHYGVPMDFVSDRDPKFTSAFFVEWCKVLGVVQKMSSAYHPQTDGQTERTNRTVEQLLRFYILPDQSNWDEALPMAAFAINRAYNQATKATPFEVVLGYNPASPFERLLSFAPESNLPKSAWRTSQEDCLQKVKHALNVAQSRMLDYASGHRPTVKLQVGDLAWLSTKNLNLKAVGTRKFVRRYMGPFPVIQVINPQAYKLQLPSQLKLHPVFHVSELYKVPPSTRLPPEPTIVEVDDNEEFFIEAILDHRVTLNRKHKVQQYQYLTTFVNEGPEENRWLFEDDFTSDGAYSNPVLDHYKQLHQLSTPDQDGTIDKSTTGKRSKRVRTS